MSLQRQLGGFCTDTEADNSARVYRETEEGAEPASESERTVLRSRETQRGSCSLSTKLKATTTS